MSQMWRERGRRGRHRAGLGTIAALAAILLVMAGCTGESDTGADAAAVSSQSGSMSLVAEVHRSPTCACCEDHADYLEEHGFMVRTVEHDDLGAYKESAGVPMGTQSCHTTVIDGYAVEGHVPMEAIDRLLAERPAVDGIALPGMPAGSPGMGGAQEEPFEIVTFNGGEVAAFMTLGDS